MLRAMDEKKKMKKEGKEGRKEGSVFFLDEMESVGKGLWTFGRGARMEAVFQEVRTGDLSLFPSWLRFSPRPISRSRCTRRTRHKSLINHRERMGL